MNRFLAGNILREVKNGRLNCNNPKDETFKDSNRNGTYVKKIRRNNQVFPYASSQWQKKNIKNFAEIQGHKISPVRAISTKEATIEGNPFENYDEDVMGFMMAEAITITEEEYNKLDDKEKKLWSKKGKKYKRNITKKRRSNLMLSPLQAIGHTKIVDEFNTRETNETPILYSKEVYSTNMSSSFILDIDNIGKFTNSDNAAGYRDYLKEEVKIFGLNEKNGLIILDEKMKLKRIKDTIKALQFMTTRTTMTNNLEDLSAKFIIFGEYSIGNSLFNNIFEDNRLKIDYLKEAIEENEPYRLSKIYVGCRSKFFNQDDKWLKDMLEDEFRDDNRFILGSVDNVVTEYLNQLSI